MEEEKFMWHMCRGLAMLMLVLRKSKNQTLFSHRSPLPDILSLSSPTAGSNGPAQTAYSVKHLGENVLVFQKQTEKNEIGTGFT